MGPIAAAVEEKDGGCVFADCMEKERKKKKKRKERKKDVLVKKRKGLPV